MKYKVGVTISVVYFPDGRFVEHGIATVSKQLENKGFQEYKKGDRVMVRFVKSVKSFGITVQLNAKTFGNIELCEITDKLEPNMLTEIKERGIFLARVIDTDKKGRL
jgi:ribosomal protein S1